MKTRDLSTSLLGVVGFAAFIGLIVITTTCTSCKDATPSASPPPVAPAPVAHPELQLPTPSARVKAYYRDLDREYAHRALHDAGYTFTESEELLLSCVDNCFGDVYPRFCFNNCLATIPPDCTTEEATIELDLD